MATYSQALRPIRVTTPLGEDAFLVERFTAVEQVSRTFSFSLDLLSENKAVKAASMLRKPLTLVLDPAGTQPRHLHGIVRSFRYAGPRAGEMAAYHVEVVPWAWLLTLNRTSRCFQSKSVPDIIQQVFKDKGMADFRLMLVGTFQPRDFCVQYQETDWDFVSRLMEEEGIFYFFEHAADKHTLVIANSPTAVKASGAASVRMAPAVGAFLKEEVVWEVSAESDVGLHSVLLADASAHLPAPSQTLWIPQAGTAAAAKTGEDLAADFEYPARHAAFWESSSGDTPANASKMRADGVRLQKIRCEEREATLSRVTGWSNCRNLRAGAKIEIAEHPNDEIKGPYHLIAVTHSGSMSLRTGDENPYEYSNEFVCIPFAVPYRPPRLTPRPVIAGVQTAIVTGPPGEEIYTDKLGRVKIKFHWDPTKVGDDKSSCWVRVASIWAGKGWGMINIPRIGQEVVVQFLEGDPDRPIIIGGVYNADQMPPLALPGAKNKSTLKSNTTPGGGGSNELRFDDSKGKEEIFLNAQYDMNSKVGHDRTLMIGNNDTIDVKVDRTEKVGGNETITVEKDRTETVKGKETIKVTGDRALTVTGKDTIDVTGDVSISSKGKVKITSVSEIKLEVGGSSITIGPTNIEIAAGVGVKVVGNATAELSASGQTTVKGAIVMIN